VLTIPAAVWRGGAVRRGVTIGGCVGLFFGALAWLDSGMLLAGVIVLVVLGVGAGLWMPRRMVRYWPESRVLNGAQRVAVVGAARRGHPVGDRTLGPAVAGYSRGLRAAAERTQPLRWVIVAVLVVAIGAAVWDAVLGSVGSAVVSVIYLIFAALELFWWPRRTADLLANAERAAAMARPVKAGD
jgi:hypothetical protein